MLIIELRSHDDILFGGLGEIDKRIGISIRVWKVAVGYLHADAVSIFEHIAGSPEVQRILSLQRLHQMLITALMLRRSFVAMRLQLISSKQWSENTSRMRRGR